MTSRYAIVIPAYRPASALLDVLGALTTASASEIIVVDDGSGPDFQDLFAQVATFPHVTLLRNPQNTGKGGALKRAFQFVLAERPGLAGVVTADADGQHHPDDILRVADALLAAPESLVMGARTFHQEVPLRSRFGNILTRGIMRALVGARLTDTQTGLRGIPLKLLAPLLEVNANGYEFELEMLVLARHLQTPVFEVPIQTIYEPGNKSSHFNPLVDSMKIYFVLLRFVSVSLLSAALDTLVFSLLYRRLGQLDAQILGRVVSVIFNYWMVRTSVFYARKRHLETLPKYLALVLASGTASYFLIRLLWHHFGWNPVAAKLLVESGLFFVNFAVQRLFIFGQRRTAGARRSVALSWAVGGILAVITALEIYGFATSHLFSQEIWTVTGIRRFIRFAALYADVAVPLLILVPWTVAPVAAALFFGGTLLATGPLALLAVILFLLSSSALGSKLLGASNLCATVAGAAIYIFLMTCIARLPVNYPLFWTALLLVPLAWDFRGVRARLAAFASSIRRLDLRGWERATFGLMLFVFAMHWLVALKPESSADGLAVHLAVCTNIAAHHALTFQPDRFLWAVMPMGGDFAYAIVYLLGGEPATHLLNFSMLLILAGLLFHALRHWVSRTVAFLLLALFAATPLVQLVTGSLFIENLLAVMIFAFLTALWRFGETGERKWLLAAALFAGTALDIKLAAAAFVAFALPFVVIEIRRHRPRLLWCVAAVGILLATGLPPYVHAWMRTGNPVFPFRNPRFPSPLLDRSAEILDYRFREPLRWTTAYDLTFHSTRFYEGQNGSVGFQYLLLVPLALAALLAVRRRTVAAAAVVALGGLCVVFINEPNARYLYAAMPLLFVPFAAILDWLKQNRRILYGALLAFAVICTAIDIYFLPSAGWYQKDFYSHFAFARNGWQRYIHEVLPIRDVMAWCNRAHPGATLLFTADNDVADSRGDVYQNNWHQYSTWDAIQNTANWAEMMRLAERWHIQYIVARNRADQPRGLRLFLQNCTTPEYQNGGAYVARVNPDCAAGANTVLTAIKGTYDDFDPVIRFTGDWSRSEAFPNAIASTVTYTNTPGAEASIVFDGRALTYIYTRASNRGQAELTIDNSPPVTIDLYSPTTEWQAKYRICCLAPGRHTATVKVLTRFVDLDAFLIE